MIKLFSAYKISLIIALLSFGSLFAETNEVKLFKLQDVQLKDSPFREAMLTDLHYMMQLNPDRLLAPFLKEAGLEPKAENYPNWENTGLDGHITGDYLTALAQMYASTGDQEALDRLNYMLSELRGAQLANANGYIGGVPEAMSSGRKFQKEK